MNLKATVFFSIWTSFWCSVFNWIYVMIPALGGHPWIMFICLAVFFALNLGVKDVGHLMCSATCGVFWGQIDLLLMVPGGIMLAGAGFLPILIGTAITMILHIFFLEKTPVRDVPIIFAGVALTFGCGIGFLDWTGILGLWLSMMFGLVLCGVCSFGMNLGIKKFMGQE